MCALNALFDNQVSCKYHVRIVIPKDRSRLITKNNTPRITLLELCLFLQESPIFTIYKYKFPLNIESVIDYDMYFLSKNLSNKTPTPRNNIIGGNNKTRKTLKTRKIFKTRKTLKTRKQ